MQTAMVAPHRLQCASQRASKSDRATPPHHPSRARARAVRRELPPSAEVIATFQMIATGELRSTLGRGRSHRRRTPAPAALHHPPSPSPKTRTGPPVRRRRPVTTRSEVLHQSPKGSRRHRQTRQPRIAAHPRLPHPFVQARLHNVPIPSDTPKPTIPLTRKIRNRPATGPVIVYAIVDDSSESCRVRRRLADDSEDVSRGSPVRSPVLLSARDLGPRREPGITAICPPLASPSSLAPRPCHAEGREFESHHPLREKPRKRGFFFGNEHTGERGAEPAARAHCLRLSSSGHRPCMDEPNPTSPGPGVPVPTPEPPGPELPPDPTPAPEPPVCGAVPRSASTARPATAGTSA